MSATPRLFVNADLSAGAQIALAREDAHYLLNVMRRSAGDPVRVFNGRDGEWAAMIARADKRNASLNVGACTRVQTQPPDLELAFAPVKKARTDFIVEKATELGARSIQPVMTRFTQSERVRVDRLQALVKEAAEQTERLDLPQVSEAVKLEAFLDAFPAERRLLYCDEAGDDPDAPWGGEGGRARPIRAALSDAQASDGWTILIGPEGGFSAEERRRLRAEAFCLPVTLGPRILRADTAAAAAMSVWQAMLGDWGSAVTRP